MLDGSIIQLLLLSDIGPFRSTSRRVFIRLATFLVLATGAIGFVSIRGNEEISIRLLTSLTLACILAVLSALQLVRLVKENTRPKVLKEVAPLDLHDSGANTNTQTWSLLHWSDLHLTQSEDTPRVQGGTSGNRAYRLLFERWPDGLDAARLVLLTGDITDRGDGEEWRTFFAMTPASVLRKMLILPGNHDVNVLFSKHVATNVEAGNRVLQRLRILRMVAAMDLVQGDRTFVFDDNIRQYVTLREMLRPHAERFREFSANPAGVISEPPAFSWSLFFRALPVARAPVEDVITLWRKLFPMVSYVEQSGTAVVLLDSNRLGRSIYDNAFGTISESSLSALQSFVSSFHGPLIVAIHHHLTAPPYHLPSLTAAEIRFMVLDNPEALLNVLGNNREVPIFHGHVHIGYRVVVNGQFQVISAPSTGLGDEFMHSPPEHYSYEIETGTFGARIRSAQKGH
jgi:3',5'-cyclic AMP phosphodiesterase CpdA